MSASFDIWLQARRLDYTTSLQDSTRLKQLDHEIRADMGKGYRLLDEINARVAELDGPAVLPRPSRQTDKQRLVARCPRCRGRIQELSPDQTVSGGHERFETVMREVKS